MYKKKCNNITNILSAPNLLNNKISYITFNYRLLRIMFRIFLYVLICCFSACKEPSGSGSDPSVNPNLNNSNLEDIIISSGSLSPDFVSDSVSYNVFIANNIENITVSALSSAPNTKIELQLNDTGWIDLISGIISPAIEMSIGPNILEIRTTAEDGVTFKIYTISVYRLSASAYLSNINIDAGTLDPVFDPYTMNYSMNVPDTVESVSITAVTPAMGETIKMKVNNGEWQDIVSGNPSPVIYLDAGSNIIEIAVTSEDTTNTNTYIINIYRLFPPPLLSNLTSGVGSFSPSFDPESMDYEVLLNNSQTSYSVTPASADDSVTIEVQINSEGWETVSSGFSSEVFPLSVGDNLLEVRLTTSDGLSSSIYTINAHRKSIDADLSNIFMSAGPITPVFDSSIVSYVSNVSSNIDSVTVTAELSYSLSTIHVQVNGGEWYEVDDGSPSAPLSLNTGDNTVSIRVTSEEGSPQKTYSIDIYRQSGNAALSGLSINNGTLKPSFNPAILNYTDTVSRTDTSVTVTPTADDLNASIQIRNNEGEWQGVASGVPSNQLDLVPGENFIEVKVTAEDNSISKLYEIILCRPCHGAVDLGFVTGSGPDDLVFTIALQNDGKILIGGRFTSYNNYNRKYIVRLNNDGSIDTSFNPTINGPVRKIILQDDGRILIGGEFDWFKYGFHNNIARLNSDGSIDNSFLNTGSGADKAVMAISVQDDEKVLVGGRFYNFNDNQQLSLIRLISNGTPDPLFSIGSGFNDLVADIIIQPDGQILVSGWFYEYNGITSRGIIRLNENGTIDHSFTPDSALTQEINTISLQENGKIIIGGWFSTNNWVSRRSLGRLNSDGSFDNSFLSATSSIDGSVGDIYLLDDGRFYICGAFTALNGVIRRGIALLNSDGTLDDSFLKTNYGAEKEGPPIAGVLKIKLQADGKIIVAGDFTSFNGINSPFLVRLWGE